MNKLSIPALLLTLAAVLAAPAAWAAIDTANAPNGAHYRQRFGDPVCSVSGLTVTCGPTAIAGIGNTDATLTLSVSYAATVQCRNHGGQVVEVKTQSTTSTVAPDDVTEVRNGTLYVRQFSSGPAPTSQSFLDQATCPNPNWTKELQGSPTVTSFTYRLTFDGFTDPAITVTGPSGS